MKRFVLTEYVLLACLKTCEYLSLLLLGGLVTSMQINRNLSKYNAKLNGTPGYWTRLGSPWGSPVSMTDVSKQTA